MKHFTSWTFFCEVTEDSHENLIQCSHCHARNSQISFTVSSNISVRRTEIVDLRDFFFSLQSKSSIFTTSQIASRFAFYNHAESAETLHQSQFLWSSIFTWTERCQNSAFHSVSPLFYQTIVTFYLLQYVISVEQNSEGLAQVISCQQIGMFLQNLDLLFITNRIEQIMTQVSSHTIASLQDFIINDLVSDMTQDSR